MGALAKIYAHFANAERVRQEIRAFLAFPELGLLLGEGLESLG